MKSARLVALLCAWTLGLSLGCVPIQEYEDGNKLAAQGKLKKAYTFYETALGKTESEEEKQMIMRALQKTGGMIADQALVQSRQVLQSQPAPNMDTLSRATVILQEAMLYEGAPAKIGAKLEDLQDQLAKLEDRAQDLGKRAMMLAGKKDFREALAAIKQALDLDPANQDFLMAQQDIAAREASYYSRQIKSAIALSQWGKAQKSLALLREAKPGHPMVAAAEKEIQLKARDDILAKIRFLKSGKRFYQAYLLIKESGFAQDLGSELETLTEAGRAYYLVLGQRALAAKRIFDAYVASVKAKEFAPDDSRVFELHRNCTDLVDKALQGQVGVAAFGSPRRDPDAGLQFSDDLINHLFRHLPYGIGVVERRKLDAALVKTRGDAAQAGRKVGVRIVVNGDVSLLEVDEKKTQRFASTKAKSGVETVPNPQYYEFLEKYGSDKDSWPSRQPKTITRPHYERVHYHKGKVVLDGFINVSVRIVNTADGTLSYSKVLKDRMQFSDHYQDPVPDAVTPVREDPLELPSETEVKENLKTAVIKKISEVVVGQFANREKQFIKQAKYHVERRERDLALQNLAKAHLYARRAKLPPNDPGLKEINQMILGLTE